MVRSIPQDDFIEEIECEGMTEDGIEYFDESTFDKKTSTVEVFSLIGGGSGFPGFIGTRRFLPRVKVLPRASKVTSFKRSRVVQLNAHSFIHCLRSDQDCVGFHPFFISQYN
jgi:hypothetical protein